MIKALFYYVLTGWRSVDFFGLPKPGLAIKGLLQGVPNHLEKVTKKEVIGSINKDYPQKSSYSFVYYVTGFGYYCPTKFDRSTMEDRHKQPAFRKCDMSLTHWKKINVD